MVGVHPKKLIIGQNGKLKCQYDMEGAEMYSLKWYKNGKEFYRYMPGQERKTTIFDAPGVLIDLQYSDIHQLHLKSVSLETAGQYRCEVSTEAPDFDTLSESVKVDVISLPRGPKISGLELAYSPGDLVKANCSAHSALPPASLIWYINKESVKSESRYNGSLSLYPLSSMQTPVSYLQTFNKNNLTTSHLQLIFTLKLSHFQDGKLKLKCTAFLEEIFMRSQEVSVEQTRSRSSLDSYPKYPYKEGGGYPSGGSAGEPLFGRERTNNEPKPVYTDTLRRSSSTVNCSSFLLSSLLALSVILLSKLSDV